MTEIFIGFGIWFACGCMFIGFGINALCSKEAVGFWANAKMFEVTDVKKYNRAMCKLFCAMGVIFMLLGIPLLMQENTVWILLSVAGVMVEVIVMMVIYIMVIEKKYKKR